MDDPDLLRRRIIHSLISNISLNAGFVNAETTVIETLTEMFINYISQMTVQTKLLSELQGRTDPTLHDLATCFIDLGVDLRSLYKYIRSLKYQKYNKIASPSIATAPKPPQVLHTIKPRSHFNYIFDHFPPFPDPHTYILTECTMANERESQKSRELVAEHKIDIERDIIKFRLRNELFKHSSKNLSIFQEDTKDTIFMLIPNEILENSDPMYLKALTAK